MPEHGEEDSCDSARGALPGASPAPAAAQADTGDIIAPQNSPPTRGDGWQAGTCNVELPNAPLRPAGPVLHPGRRPPAGRLHPVHRQARRRRHALLEPVGDAQGRAGRPAGRAQRQPAGDAAVRRWRPSQRTRSAARRARSSAPASSPLASPGVAVPPVPARRSTTSSRARANRRCSASARRLRTSSSKPTSTGAATTTRASRSPSPNRPLGRDPQEPAGLHRRRRQRHLPDQPEHLPRPGAGRLRSTPTRPTCGPTRSRCPSPNFPDGSTQFEAALPPGVKPTGCDAGAVRTRRSRSTPGTNADRLARRRRGRGHASPSNRCRRSPTRT